MKCDWERHILRAKHIDALKEINLEPKKLKKTYNCECNKTFMSTSGLWKHKKICMQNADEIIEPIENLEKEKENTTNDELIQYLINENKEFKNLILEVCKNVQGINTNNINNNNNCNNTNTNNSHNKTFNLQFFLNETCKDAMNMSEFIDSVKLQLTDLESVGKLGFVDGISNIIIKNLEALDVVKRPVHCSDSKRETMYITPFNL
jgi:hypothetical protein